MDGWQTPKKLTELIFAYFKVRVGPNANPTICLQSVPRGSSNTDTNFMIFPKRQLSRQCHNPKMVLQLLGKTPVGFVRRQTDD